MELLGDFTLTIKPITIINKLFSRTQIRKISRVGKLNEHKGTYNLSAYLIAQLGKNYNSKLLNKISGKELLGLAIAKIKKVQAEVGGMVVFLETESKEKLLKFYKEENDFYEFNFRSKNNGTGKLIQMLRFI